MLPSVAINVWCLFCRSCSNSHVRKLPQGTGQLQQGEDFDTAQAAEGIPTADHEPFGGSDADGTGLSGDEADSEENRDVNVDGPSSGGRGFGALGAEGAGSGSSSPGHRRQQQQGLQKQLQTAKLSKYEAGKLEQAKQRHKAQIAQPKVRLQACLPARYAMCSGSLSAPMIVVLGIAG